MSRIFNQVSEHSTKATITAMANGKITNEDLTSELNLVLKRKIMLKSLHCIGLAPT